MKSHPIFVSTKKIFGVKIPKKNTFRDFGSLFTLHYSNNFCYSIFFFKKLRIFFLSFSFFFLSKVTKNHLPNDRDITMTLSLYFFLWHKVFPVISNLHTDGHAANTLESSFKSKTKKIVI